MGVILGILCRILERPVKEVANSEGSHPFLQSGAILFIGTTTLDFVASSLICGG